jgi:glutathione synthase/RimK-type ligase-like ATP-grasp enzyme
MPSRRLRIATCRPLPEPDVDEDLLLDALHVKGIEARMAAWNDPAEDWSEATPTVIRSTWDYLHDLPGFLAWATAAAAAAPLWNPLEVIRWNAHKRYLVELATAGLPVVPTALVERGTSYSFLDARAKGAFGEGPVVVKPAVSAGSFSTRRFEADDAPGTQRFIDELAAERDVLVQPYVASVDHYGERSVVVIDGVITHAIRKSPRFSGEHEIVSEAVPVDAAEAEMAHRVLQFCSKRTSSTGGLLYARVDLARDGQGRPMLMELEVIEPSLFLQQSPGALEALVAAIAKRV